MTEMSISQVAQQAGIKPSTIRYYESLSLLPEPPRISGRRRYDDSVLQRLSIIQTARRAGFSLDEVRLLFDDILVNAASKQKWHSLIAQKLEQLNKLLLNVQNMKSVLQDISECDDAALEECLYETGQKHDEPISVKF